MTPTSRAAARAVLGAAGSLGLLAVGGWAAAVDPRPDEPRHAFTLAPIMATGSIVGGQPLYAGRRGPAVQVGPWAPASLAR
ncbi:MAG TPA: hypothetical protein VE084_24625 [Burkholderiaceae bacterium]|nr:hypothetical protein [Burkholderiaceae bacterium]